MIPFQEKINYPSENSFVLRYNDFSHFTVPWHFHNEFEMAFIVESTGKRFVGDSIENFGPGDFAFYGSTLPHLHHSDQQYYTLKPELRVKAFILQFPYDYFSNNQLLSPEYYCISRLLNSSSRGLKFPAESKLVVEKMLFDMHAEKGFKRYILLIELLNYLGGTKFSPIASPAYTNSKDQNIDVRMSEIYDFTTQNYNRKISLPEIASIVSMNSAAFCRYFKKKTGKTFADYTNDLRISYASKLLRHSNNTIEFVCYETGFNNISNFNRQFKLRTGKSPSEYRKTSTSENV